MDAIFSAGMGKQLKANWKVVPICGYQKLDVRPEDLLNGGHFRKCETYRGGGGYDQFPAIAMKRLGLQFEPHKQFIVQLYGCNLDCPYCYVTRSGIWGPYVEYNTTELVAAFVQSGQQVFHMMGGAPALYMEDWTEVIDRIHGWGFPVFHSDFLLTEKDYDPAVLADIASYDGSLFAVDIKGVTPADFLKNTRKPLKESMFWANLDKVNQHGLKFYLTFTAPDRNHFFEFCDKLKERYGKQILDDSFVIDLIDYDATPFVDILPAKIGGKLDSPNV